MFSDRSRGAAAQAVALLPSTALAALLHAHFPEIADSYSADSNSLFHLFCDEDQTALAALLTHLLVHSNSFNLPASRSTLFQARLAALRQTLAADGWTVSDDSLTYAPVDAGLIVLNTVIAGLTDFDLDPAGRLAAALRESHRAFGRPEAGGIAEGCAAAWHALDLLFAQAAALAAAQRGDDCANQSIDDALATLHAADIVSTDDAAMLSQTVASIHTHIDTLGDRPRADDARWVEHMVVWTCGFVGSQFAAI